MRTRILMALAVVAGSTAVGCTSVDTTGPEVPSAVAFGGEEPPPPCDPTKDVCDEPAIGRMTGGGGQVTIGDVFVSRGLTLHCDITLSNNLEINWAGNRWHLDKPITSASCIDDPAVNPAPPPAPFDTFIGEGVGRLNGVDGYLVQFTFVDGGEPGGRNDRAAILITAPDGSTALNVPMSALTRGNLQAHYDQPHR
jgi:hypothetical protein